MLGCNSIKYTLGKQVVNIGKLLLMIDHNVLFMYKELKR